MLAFFLGLNLSVLRIVVDYVTPVPVMIVTNLTALSIRTYSSGFRSVLFSLAGRESQRIALLQD